jgi:PPOX class probable F420-dependent enzyme
VNLPPWARELLQAPVARLATVDATGVSSLVPICFVVDRDDIVWSAIDEKPKSGQELKRIRNIRDNPHCALLADRYDDDWSRLAWVLLRGRAEVVPASDAPGALELLRAKYAQYDDMALESSYLISLPVDVAVSWRASSASE